MNCISETIIKAAAQYSNFTTKLAQNLINNQLYLGE